MKSRHDTRLTRLEAAAAPVTARSPVVIYRIGEPLPPRAGDVTIYIPDNGREAE